MNVTAYDVTGTRRVKVCSNPDCDCAHEVGVTLTFRVRLEGRPANMLVYLCQECAGDLRNELAAILPGQEQP